jgi:predicted amidohydrolase
MRFTGRSQVVDPYGRVLWRAGAARPEARVVGIDLAAARDKGATRANDLFRDRVPALYGALVRPAGQAQAGRGPRR